MGEAWTVYDRWPGESRVGILHESFELDAAFRAATWGFPAVVPESAGGIVICLL